MKRLLFIIILITLPIYSQNIWEETFITNGYPKKIEIVDSNNIFIANMGGSISRLYKSTNQGKNWNIMYEGSKTGIESLNDMSVIDNDNIYMSFSKGHLMRSSDGGGSFEQVLLKDVEYARMKYISMLDKSIGVCEGGLGGLFITTDGWKTFNKFSIDSSLAGYSYHHPKFINDSIIYSIAYDFSFVYNFKCIFLVLNINSQQYKIYDIDVIFEGISDLSIVNDDLIFACGKSNTISGGSGHDAIYKSTNGGKHWRRVLDFYSNNSNFSKVIHPFGLQQIAFSDSMTGIAVGQFGKILYTYDGGESWIYEKELHKSITKNSPPTMIVKYAGCIPILAAFNGSFFRMVEDKLSPGPEDTMSICGRVWDGDKGLSGVLISLGLRVTMTDSLGYYKFTQLKKGSYLVKALNKYLDYSNLKDYYKPFDFTPFQHEIELTSDTSGFDFNATDLRTYHTISGYVVDTYGNGLADIDVRFARSVTTADGLGLADTKTKTDSSGKFEFKGVESYKHWDITPVNDTLKFSPLKHTVRLINGDTTDLKFTGTPITSVWERGKDRGISIKPNPAHDFITIKLSNKELQLFATEDKVQIFDVLGIEVMTLETRHAVSLQRIDVSHLPAGVYFIRFGNKVEKFVKM